MKYIYPSITFVVALIIFFAVGVPQYKILLTERAYNKDLRQGVVSINEASDKLDKLESDVNSISTGDRNIISNVVPASFDNTLFAHYMSSLALKHGLLLRGIVASPINDPKSKITAYDVSMSLVGRYNIGLKDFLSDISRNVVWSRVMKFNAVQQGEKGDMNYEITVRTYANK